ncbi:hypothetical protein M272_01190 [Vibrio natriegens NBRC 15636 = ATCC 14048 = DSM 759]|nr:hypothetical protein M272_01190 [Vibrio natriegens NBRC 15636 = ATCC 14048 = DSM 759]
MAGKINKSRQEKQLINRFKKQNQKYRNEI